MIWFQTFTLENLTRISENTMASHLGIEINEIGDDYLKATMPITAKSVQPFRTMHGGASAALAETIGSIGSQMCVDPSNQKCVGLSLNVSHIRAVPEGGMVTATARPFHVGRTTHVWDIQVVDEREKVVTVARLTVAVLNGSANEMKA